MRPLSGRLVLDFSTLLPGPLTTLLLAEAGAEVVKVERPGTGDEMRGYDPRWAEDSFNFALLNRGKRSLALDLKDPDARKRLDPLLDRADVLVEQFRPGVMARLGLDFAAVHARNPRLVYCSISGYGQSGPKSLQAGHDLNYVGDAGLLALSMGSPHHPVLPPALIADIAGGAYPAVINILLALEASRLTGRGRWLDISMSDNLFTFQYWALGQGLGTGAWPRNGKELVTGGSSRYQLYPTRDGRMIAAAPLEERFWQIFCGIVGLPEALRDDRRDPQATQEAVAALIAAETASTWSERFAGSDCCASIVATLQEALDDPHFRARGLFDHQLRDGAGRCIPALPVPLDSAFRGEAASPLGYPALGGAGEALFDAEPPGTIPAMDDRQPQARTDDAPGT